MILSLQQLEELLPTNKNVGVWLDPLNELLAQYEINTVNRVAGFMAQTSHESNDYKNLEENLYYSADRLMQVWSKRYFPNRDVAKKYEKNPEKLANYVYANRMDNGDEDSGDGWRFRGAGIKQITGRYNFTEFGKTIGMTAEQAADYIRTTKGSVHSAVWYWNLHKLNKTADAKNIKLMTEIINGGLNGLADRTLRFNRALKILQTADQITTKDLRVGSRGAAVIKIQKAFGLNADGIFGKQTDQAVRSWQRAINFEPTGIITEEQYAILVGEIL